MEGSSKNRPYFVIAKNLSSNQVVFCNSAQLHVVTEDFRYWPFRPENILDFTRNQDYGMIVEDKMVLHWILLMTDSKAQRDALWASGKVRKPKRVSTSATEHPLQVYSLQNEKKKARTERTQKMSTVSQSGKRDADNVLKRNKKLLEAQPKRTSPRKTPKKNLGFMQLSAPINVLNKSEEDLDDNDGGSPPPKRQKEEKETGTGKIKGTKDEKATNSSTQSFEGSTSTKDTCDDMSTKESNEDGQFTEHLKFVCLKCIDLQGQVALKTQEAGFYKQKCEDLEKEKVEWKAEKEKLLNIEEKLLQSTGSKKEHIRLKDLKEAVQIEKSHAGFVIPEGEVYVGRGKTLNRNAIIQADVHPSIGMKLKGIAQLMWPDGIHFHSLQINSTIRITGVVKVEKIELEAFKGILNSMTWSDEGHEVSLKEVKDHLKHVCSQARTDYLKSNPSAMIPDRKITQRKTSKKPTKHQIENKSPQKTEGSAKMIEDEKEKEPDTREGENGGSDSDATHYSGSPPHVVMQKYNSEEASNSETEDEDKKLVYDMSQDLFAD